MSSVTTLVGPSLKVSDQKLKRLREDIRMGRLAARMSQRELAFRIGKSQRFLSMIERGDRNPRMDDLAAIAAILEPALGRNLLEDLSDD